MSFAPRHPVALTLTLIAVASASVVSGCAGTSRKPVAVRRPSSPCTRVTGVRQAADGTISGCIQVSPLSAGSYVVGLQSFLQFASGPPSPALVRKLLKGRRLRLPPPVRLTLRLSPSSGPPGTRVTVVGRLAVPITPRQRRSLVGAPPEVCWDGCQQGLTLASGPVHWNSDKSFTVRANAPAAPWLEGERGGQILGLRSGSYPIGVQCIDPSGLCGLAGAQGAARFTLEVGHPPAWCTSLRSCGILNAVPASARPGSVVRISGHAPLIEFDTPGNRFYGQLRFSRTRSRGVPDLSIKHDLGSLATVTVGQAHLRVLAPISYASLAQVAPITEVSGGNTPVAGDPADPRIVAWCGEHSIGLSVDGVRRTVSIAGVREVLIRDGYEVLGGPGGCADVLPLDRRTLLASFGVALKQFGAPPIFLVALITHDDGRSWTPVPVPRGTRATGFGSFRESQAIFAKTTKPGIPTNPARPLGANSKNGKSWRSGTLSCPSRGPCVTLGPLLTGNCAMGLSTQDVLASGDGGARWRAASIAGQLMPCGEAELYATGPHTVMLVNSLSPFVLQRSTDDGDSWSDVSLPLPSGLKTLKYGIGFGPGGITVLRDGALLLSGEVFGGASPRGWQLLRPGADRWCRVRGVPARLEHQDQESSLTVIGTQLWWLTYKPVGHDGGSTTEVHAQPLADIRCAAG